MTAQTDEFENDPFDAPATSEFVDWEELKGALLVLEVEEYIPSISTVHGDNPAVKADLTVLEGATNPELNGQTFEGTLIFGRSMIPQLRKRVGRMVLARLGQGAKQKGKNAPWVLNDPSPEDRKVARKWHESRKTDPFESAGDVNE